MERLTRADIKTNEEYLKERDARRKQIIELKKRRRISVGPRLSLTFENRETIGYQIQEMMRVERIADEDKIQFEIDTYNDLIPVSGCLSATLFIEIAENDQIKSILDRFQGLDQSGILFMILDGERIAAEFEAGHSKEDRISAVHYLKFRFTPEQIAKFAGAQVEIHVNHPNYKAVAALTTEQKQELARDFSG